MFMLKKYDVNVIINSRIKHTKFTPGELVWLYCNNCNIEQVYFLNTLNKFPQITYQSCPDCKSLTLVTLVRRE